MNYNELILRQLDIVNKVLMRYNQPAIFDNSDFAIAEISWEEFLKIEFKKENAVNFDIIISNSGIQIDIDRIVEAVSINSKDFEKHVKMFEDYLTMVLTSFIKVDYYGSNYTKLYFMDEKGECVKTLKYVTGLYLKRKPQSKQYAPIFSGAVK